MGRENNITMVHISAALLVIVGHMYVLLGMSPPTVMGCEIHGLGVRVLFLISGYLVTMSYLKTKKASSFLRKRILRLYPPLLVCLLISVLVLSNISTAPEFYWDSARRYIINNLEMRPKFDLAGVFDNNPYPVGVNGSLWTLPIEIVCYLLVIPITKIYVSIEKKSNTISKVMLVVALICLSVFDIYKQINLNGLMLIFWDTDWYNAISLFIYFFIGMIFYLFDLRKICNFQVAMVVSIIFMCLSGSIKAFLIPYIIGYDVMCFALADKPKFKSLFKRDICYGLYLYAFPVQQLLIYIFKIKYNINISISVFLAISVLVIWTLAEISFRFVERPVTKIFLKNN